MSYFTLALLQISLLGLLSGIAGTFIVLRRRSFFAVALSHATFPGGVVFAIFGLNLLAGQALFAVLLVLVMTALSRVPRQGRQVTSGVVLAFGFALGTLLSSLNPDLGVPVEALLVGSVLSVAVSDVIATAAVLAVSVLALWFFGRRVLFHTFDPAGFEAAGFKAWHVELVVTGVIAASVVVAMPAVGAILGVAILIAPAAAARLISPRIEWIPPVAAVLGVASGALGLVASRHFDLAAGGAIGLATTLVFMLAWLWRAVAAASGKGDVEMTVVKRNTWQREAVRARLAEAQGFVSAQQLHAVLRDEGSTIGLATVYRNLAQLAASGEADSLQSPEGENLFRSCSTKGHHHHLICRGCGATEELKAKVVEEWANRVAAEHGFSDIEHVVDLFGLCASCRAAGQAGGQAAGKAPGQAPA